MSGCSTLCGNIKLDELYEDQLKFGDLTDLIDTFNGPATLWGNIKFPELNEDQMNFLEHHQLKFGDLNLYNGDLTYLIDTFNRYEFEDKRWDETDDDGIVRWYFNGKLDRANGPAVIYPDGSEEWYHLDKLHRLDGPAIVRANGTRLWYKNGKLHRDGELPAIIEVTEKGLKQSWYIEGIEQETGILENNNLRTKSARN